jgi:hypothetical protein
MPPCSFPRELVDEAETVEYLSRELGYETSPLVSPLKCVKQLDPSHYLANVGWPSRSW